VLLQIMSDAGNISRDLHLVYKSNSCDLTESRVRLLGCRSIHTRANTTFLGISLQCWRSTLHGFVSAAFADQLIDGGQHNLLYSDHSRLQWGRVWIIQRLRLRSQRLTLTNRVLDVKYHVSGRIHWVIQTTRREPMAHVINAIHRLRSSATTSGNPQPLGCLRPQQRPWGLHPEA